RYVELDRVASRMQTRLDATPSSVRAYLRVPGHVVTFTRNWAQVLVDGQPVVLDAPVRVKAGAWLVPETFVARVLPRMTQAGPPAALPKTAVQTAAGALEELRFRSYPSFTRVVLETSQAVTYRLEQSGPREARVRVVGFRSEPRIEEVRDGLVAEVRVERAGRDLLLRVVFEGQPGEVKAMTLLDPHRLVLDFGRPVDETIGERVQAAPLRAIVLDAGHGGQDTGAVGPSGLTEKELVLDVTRRVAKLVEEQLKIKVLLTRDDDNFVTLRDRTTMANRARADLFVSIHANAHRHAVSGVETYFLSSEATDNAARQLAALENSVVELEAPSPRARPDFVKAILWDLAQSEFQTESSRLAEIVQDSMTQALRMPNRGVKQAGFYVLGGAAMPAVLIEVGFVSNPQEERRLRDSRYRDEIARAIVAGLVEYRRHWDQRLRALVERGR
ncbi:MAG: N-acetylmuramoyl-L-alanine amidase family protein, partial [Candidatus Rokuibacteriota bacterium]